MELNKMKLVELNAHYAQMDGAEDGMTFKTKADARASIEDLEAEMADVVADVVVEVAVDEKVKTRKPFNWPLKGEIKPHRGGCKRARVVELLDRKEGATFEEIAADPVILWDVPTCKEGIKLIHSALGYGLEEKVEGDRGFVIRLVKPEGYVIITKQEITAQKKAAEAEKKAAEAAAEAAETVVEEGAAEKPGDGKAEKAA